MKLMSHLIIVLAGIYLTGCGKSPYSENEMSPEVGTTIRSRQALKYADHEIRNRSQKKKYFLIAGGKDNANFSLEILEQKRFLKNLGISEKEISCFYTIPFDKEFGEDESRYRSLAPELSHCYPAYPKYIWEQMSDGGRTEAPLYLYVTSHGSLPLKEVLKKYSLRPESRKTIEGWLNIFPQLDQFFISVDSLANGDPGNMWKRVEELNNGQASMEDLLFTPRYLKQSIERFWSKDAKKFLVIQGCYSGGFIDSSNEKYKKDTLSELTGATVMTAARYDRSSFGCNVGSGRTYFGGAYNDVLRARSSLPEDLDWARVYLDVTAKVKKLEKDYYNSLSYTERSQFLPSEPMLHTGR